MLRSFSALLVALLLAATAGAQNKEGLQERNPRYRLQINDVVEIQYPYTPDFNSTASVQPDGYISLQNGGDLHVAGKTLQETATAIEQKSSERLVNPKVTIILKEYVKPHFVLAGQVERPGSYDLRGDVGLVQAVAMGGGFKDSAKHSHVMLVRRVDNQWAEVKVVDVKRMLQSGHLDEDLRVRPDDLIVVPQNVASRMERYVRWASLSVYGISLARP